MVAELDIVRRRTARATAVVALAGAGATAGAAVAGPRLALLPLAFVLGWLNLAGP